MSDYFICPNCGFEVDIDAESCPVCGSDDETGWSEDTVYDGLFLYNDYDPNEDEQTPKTERSIDWGKYIVISITLILVVALLFYFIRWSVYLVPGALLIAGAVYFWLEIYPNTQYSKEKNLYQNLLGKARGDKDLVERWIDYEESRNPWVDRVVHMEYAIDRWERDNR